MCALLSVEACPLVVSRSWDPGELPRGHLPLQVPAIPCFAFFPVYRKYFDSFL